MPVNILAVPKLRVFAAVLCLAACDSPTQPSTVTQQVFIINERAVNVERTRTQRVVLPPRIAPAPAQSSPAWIGSVLQDDLADADLIDVRPQGPHVVGIGAPTSSAPSAAFLACNQGRGNGPDGCDPGRSNQRNPSRDE